MKLSWYQGRSEQRRKYPSMRILLQSPSNFNPSVTSLNTPTWPKPQIENLECEPILIPCLPIMEALLDLLFRDPSPFAFSPILDPTQDFRIDVWLGVGTFKLQTSNLCSNRVEVWGIWELVISNIILGLPLFSSMKMWLRAWIPMPKNNGNPQDMPWPNVTTKVGQLSLLQRKNQHVMVGYMDP